MSEMSIQQRYDDISERSGLSEDIIRRVLIAAKQSIAESLRNGDRATLPMICTYIPEKRTKLGQDGVGVETYMKIKTKISSAIETEVGSETKFNGTYTEAEADKLYAELNYIEPPSKRRYEERDKRIRTTQISGLL